MQIRGRHVFLGLGCVRRVAHRRDGRPEEARVHPVRVAPSRREPLFIDAIPVSQQRHPRLPALFTEADVCFLFFFPSCCCKCLAKAELTKWIQVTQLTFRCGKSSQREGCQGYLKSSLVRGMMNDAMPPVYSTGVFGRVIFWFMSGVFLKRRFVSVIGIIKAA